MTEREATDAEMLAAVERWARATGRWWQDSGRIPDGWSFTVWATGTARVRFRAGKRDVTEQTVDPHTALLWALLVEAGITVDVGRCPACVARSLPGQKLATTEWGMATAYGRTKPYIAHARYHPADGWLRGWGGKRRKGSSQWAQHHARPCPDCNGTGRDMREVARLVLDAAPIDNACPHASTINGHCIDCLDTGYCQGGPETLPGNAQARDHVDVCATKLQTLGNPVGLWSALWLAGKREDTTGAVQHMHAIALRHEMINYPGQLDDRVDEWRLNKRMPWTEPSTDEIRDVVVAWATARNCLVNPRQLWDAQPHLPTWSVVVFRHEYALVQHATEAWRRHIHDVSLDTLLVWALAVVSGLVADIGVCSWCGGDVMVDSGGLTPWGESIDVRCSACASKPGREVMDAAELVCWAISGAEQAREHLLAFADRWQGDGEPLGFAVAHWLAGVGKWRRAALDAVRAAWESATVPCERCEESGRVTTHHTPVPGASGGLGFAALELPGPGPGGGSRPCPDCGGHGRVRSERG